ncbi:2-dehydropantoate 2-reductase N-terminal domain-containing protein [Parafrankia sp. EUN1f]|uniref:2-dehydropantoate 2-reductase N-terminal domain-containing protein n=1 Tax=Parafrankia sp. EUN1f TaxID=102897 RepID=UPI0001C43DF4|nr:2-dehydropantoate 2-reductase N-terminal domain-containing protein [Parafrankia sp. EUN1f]EFC85762.1 Ketopantoate reductase ApbA/PanE domain protein [Parafrankia sp. EUN1f]
MTDSRQVSVCVVGAGSMGVLTGYDLSEAGVAVTFLVRPHRQEQLSRPQFLYSYDSHSLKTYSRYDVIIDPAALSGTSFDFVVVTLDGASLSADAGRTLTREIGRAFRGTSTGVILGSIGLDIRSWFLEQSGLAETQVTQGTTGSLIYEVPRAKIPWHPGVKADLLAKADYGYQPLSPAAFVVDDSAPQVAADFAALFGVNGAGKCATLTQEEFGLQFAAFPVIAAWELLDWPSLADLDHTNPTWQLGVEAMGEIQRLSIFGPSGPGASRQTTPENVLALFQQMETGVLPLDFAAFNAYHHGGKVNNQDHAFLRDALNRGELEGAQMPALRALVARLPPAQKP